MYARVVEAGEVRPGDPIELLPEAPDPRAAELALLARLDAALRRSSVVRWLAALEAGVPLTIVDDGELAMAALPGSVGPLLNRGHGFEGLPNLLERAIGFFAAQGVDGWIDLEPDGLAGLDGVEPVERMAVLAIEPDRIAANAAGRSAAPDLAIRTVTADEGAAWAGVHLAAGGFPAGAAEAWVRSSQRLAASAPGDLFVAELGGRIVAAGSLHVHKKVGWLRATAVLSEARGRGIQRALIAARAVAAAEQGATLVGSAAVPGSTSERNLREMGLVGLATRGTYTSSSLAPLTAG
jgi:GNAT superfamily N-acetyltransferase